MRVFVTGIRGVIGSHVMAALVSQGHEVSGCDLRDGCDVREYGPVEARMLAEKPEAVVHTAGIAHPSPAYSWQDYWDTNVAGTQNVAQAAVAAGVRRLVYTSSTTYYGAERGFPLGNERLAVLSPNAVQRYMHAVLPEMGPWPRASVYYMMSKIAAETVLAAFGLSERLQVRIFRLCPCSPEGLPYEWGLRLKLNRAAVVLAAAALAEADGFYQVMPLCEPDVGMVG